MPAHKELTRAAISCFDLKGLTGAALAYFWHRLVKIELCRWLANHEVLVEFVSSCCVVIGLASATSQLDRNAWQRVATYKSGSKQTWRRIFFVWNHIEKAKTDRTPAHVHFAEELQPGFSCLFSSGSDSVLHSKFLCYISGSSSRIAQCMHSTSQLQALLP